jgi:hypothetical protein
MFEIAMAELAEPGDGIPIKELLSNRRGLPGTPDGRLNL